MRKVSSLACGLVLAAAGVAQAQVVETQTTTVPPGGAPAGVRRVSQILGSTVRMQGNQNFGKVEDVVFDNNGGPGYLVVSNGGRYAMLPWNAADINYGQRYVSYNVTPQAVQPLFFAPNAWPNTADEQFVQRTTRVFPNGTVTRRESLRPVAPGVPPAGGAVVTPGVPPAGGAVVTPGAPVVDEKVKVKNNGTVKVKERIR